MNNCEKRTFIHKYTVRSLYVNNMSCIFLEGKSSNYFYINQGVAQGCTLSPTMILIHINGDGARVYGAKIGTVVIN